ncbi:MAG: hypothetical protein ACQCN4_13535 [Candidatus Bathyarchaeia archaeon]
MEPIEGRLYLAELCLRFGVWLGSQANPVMLFVNLTSLMNDYFRIKLSHVPKFT